ncbi:MAG: cadmium-translocating P-type ATPase [Marinilabiliales bacterium]|nr:cadmium-translocating P-type ATPase [Marinilabiliales bacterium]
MSSTIKKSFPVTGMGCASCALRVEGELKTQKGVKSVYVNFASASVQVEFDEADANPDTLQHAVRAIGYDLLIEEANEKEQEIIQQRHYKRLLRRTIGASLLAFPVMILGMFGMDWPYANPVMMLLATPVVVWFGRSFFIHAFKQARHGSANMDTLVALSTGISWLFSAFNTLFPEVWHARGIHPPVYFEASAVVIAFVLLGKVLEEKAKANTGSAIRKLIGLQPKTVTIIRPDGSEKVKPLALVQVMDRVLVRPGDKIPVDGELFSGTSFVDESSITGESMAVEVQPGSRVYAGTLNQKGSFTMLAHKVGSETVLAQMIRVVRDAQGSKPPVQRQVDKVAAIFVPAVLMLSLLTFGIWMTFGQENVLSHALLAMVSVLVIACPCALGLATPTAVMVGVGKGAENGILIRDAASLEMAHRIDTVVLDKTGTISEGKPVTTAIHWLVEGDEKSMAAHYLSAMEAVSEHPLAEAIVTSLKEMITEPLTPDSFESVTGSGVKARFGETHCLAGNEKLMNEAGIIVDGASQAIRERLESEANTVIFLAINQRLAAAVAELKRMGIAVYMLTGDNEKTARAVAAKVGIDHFKAGVLPSEKASFIRSLQQGGKVVAMVGDGINDSEALALADVSIAMGRGSDIAMDVAKMTLISSDLRQVPKAIRLSGKTLAAIRQNLFWAFVYNLIGIPVAAGILYPLWGFMLNPMIAGGAMAMSSVSVVTNSLRLRSAKISG